MARTDIDCDMMAKKKLVELMGDPASNPANTCADIQGTAGRVRYTCIR